MESNKDSIHYVIDLDVFRNIEEDTLLYMLRDSIKVVYDVPRVISLLEAIMYNSSSIQIKPLQVLYNKYAKEYNIDLGTIYRNWIIPTPFKQNIAKEQFNILEAFERTLKSLSISDYNSDEQWYFFIDQYNLNNAFSKIINLRDSLINEYLVFSQIYRELNKRAWFSGSTGFTYFDPFVKSNSERFIEIVENCACPLSDNDEDIRFIRRNIGLICEISVERIIQSFLQNEECFNVDQRYYWFPIQYLEIYSEDTLIEAVLETLCNEEPDGHHFYKLSTILRNEENIPLVEEELINFILARNISADNIQDYSLIRKI